MAWPLKHGMRGSKEYSSWKHMKGRCQNQRHRFYQNYGGRGIKVCDRWQKFEAFFADMGFAPTPEHELDRIDNDGYYEPGNVRWATRRENSLNRRSTMWLTFRGKTQCLSDWAAGLGIGR